jgi:hypothetical protein
LNIDFASSSEHHSGGKNLFELENSANGKCANFSLSQRRGSPEIVERRRPTPFAIILFNDREKMFQNRHVVGLDDTSLFGRPAMQQGNILDIYAENAFFVMKDAEFSKLENPKIGTTFEYAVPLFVGGALIRQEGGTTQAVTSQ